MKMTDREKNAAETRGQNQCGQHAQGNGLYSAEPLTSQHEVALIHFGGLGFNFRAW